MGRIRSGSRALAQLRGMRSYLGLMRSGGATAAEANATAATDQFDRQADRLDAPPALVADSPASVQGGSAPRSQPAAAASSQPGAGPQDPSMPCSEAQLADGWLVSGGACVPGQGPREGRNQTPWQGTVDLAESLILVACGLIMLASFLVFLAAVLIGEAPNLACVLYYLGVMCAMSAFAMGAMVQGLAAVAAYQGGAIQGGLLLVASTGIMSAALMALVMNGSTGFSMMWGALAAAMSAAVLFLSRSIRRYDGPDRTRARVAAVRG
jgi:hypothetical protein